MRRLISPILRRESLADKLASMFPSRAAFLAAAIEHLIESSDDAKARLVYRALGARQNVALH